MDLKLINRFVDKKVAIAIYDAKNKQFLPEASSLLGNVISSLEGSTLNIQPSTEAVMLDTAKANRVSSAA